MEALKKNGVPIPEMLGLSENCDIIGTPFYLMDYVEGKIYKDPRLDFLWIWNAHLTQILSAETSWDNNNQCGHF